MKWLSILIALGFLGVSFSYVLAERIETIPLDMSAVLFVNKYSGNYCVFIPKAEYRSYEANHENYELCRVEDSIGWLKFP